MKPVLDCTGNFQRLIFILFISVLITFCNGKKDTPKSDTSIHFTSLPSSQTGITFNNIRVISKETDPVVEIVNSDNIVFDKLAYKDGSSLLFRIGGDRSGKISIKNTDASKAAQKVQYEFGASEKSVTQND